MIVSTPDIVVPDYVNCGWGGFLGRAGSLPAVRRNLTN